MDLTLVWVGLTLMIGGFLVNLLGVWFQRKGLFPYDAGSWTNWIEEAVKGMFTALPKALGSYGFGVKIQAFGSVLTYLGVAFVLVFLWGQTDRTGSDGESPLPSVSSVHASSEGSVSFVAHALEVD